MSGCVTTTGAILCADNALVNCKKVCNLINTGLIVTQKLFFHRMLIAYRCKNFIPILIKKIRVRVIHRCVLYLNKYGTSSFGKSCPVFFANGQSSTIATEIYKAFRFAPDKVLMSLQVVHRCAHHVISLARKK